MKNNVSKTRAQTSKEQGKVFNSSDTKDLHRMNQDIMLKRLANYQDEDTIAKKINKFFSIFF